MADRGVEVALLTKPGCHLCDDARAVVERVCAELGAQLVELDITQDEALLAAHWEQIPVVLIEGRQHCFWTVDEARLRGALSSAAAG